MAEKWESQRAAHLVNQKVELWDCDWAERSVESKDEPRAVHLEQYLVEQWVDWMAVKKAFQWAAQKVDQTAERRAVQRVDWSAVQ